MSFMLRAAVVAAVTLGLTPAHAQGDVHKDLKAKFEAKLTKINQDFEGAFSAVFVDLTDGATTQVNPNVVLSTASTIKVPILIELFRQADAKPGMLKEQRPFDTGVLTARNGMSRLISPDSSLSLEDTAKMMINLSENGATNLLIDVLGMDNVNKTIASMGLKTMKLQRKMLDREAQARGGDNISSAADAAALMVRIARCDLPVTKESCARLRGIMEIPQPDHPGKDPHIPNNVPIAFKWGGLEGVSNAWGIVNLPDRPYVYVVMTSFGTDNEPAVRGASAAGFDYFSRLARATAYGSRVPAEVMQRARAASAP
jgi:beta-lactamase class A